MRKITAAGLFCLPSMAFAWFDGGETPVGNGLNYLISAMTGSTGAAVASLAIIAVGILCLGHYLEWRRLLQTVVGVAIIFGANAIVTGIRSFTG